jgi:hypothetical protein
MGVCPNYNDHATHHPDPRIRQYYSGLAKTVDILKGTQCDMPERPGSSFAGEFITTPDPSGLRDKLRLGVPQNHPDAKYLADRLGSYHATHNGQVLSYDYLAGFRDGVLETCK